MFLHKTVENRTSWDFDPTLVPVEIAPDPSNGVPGPNCWVKRALVPMDLGLGPGLLGPDQWAQTLEPRPMGPSPWAQALGPEPIDPSPLTRAHGPRPLGLGP